MKKITGSISMIAVTALVMSAMSAMNAMGATGALGATGPSEFPFRLYRDLSKAQSKNQPKAKNAGNFVFSPYSVSQAFLLAELGARGKTRSQIARSMDLKSSVAPPTAGENAPTLSVANRIWLEQGIQVEKSYLADSKKDAGATPGFVDFTAQPAEAADTINSWVSTKTNGKIEELIPPGALSPRTRVVLTNAVYFKGPWEEPFNKNITSDGDFTLSSGAEARVPFMHDHKRFNFIQDDLAQVIELPYFGREFAMLIALPRSGVALSKLETGLSSARLAHWENGMVSADIQLSLPRFKFDSDFVLNDALQALGVRLAFDSTLADFSGIDGKKDLFISKVFHKAFLSVDEAGTEATAATAIEMRMKAVLRAEKPIIFNADHPFIFMIEDLRSKTILFMGRVTNP